MEQILGTIGSAIGSIFDNPVLQLGFKLAAIYWLVLWIAASYWAFRDLQLRTENPVAPFLAAVLILVFFVAFPLGIYIYRVIRPQEKIGEIYERNLAEEAMLAEIEEIRHCPSCDRRVHADWIICPTCRTRLNRVCPNCTRLVGLDWSLCAWCGRDFERHDALAPVGAAPSVSAPARDALGSGEAPQNVIRTAIRTTSSRAGSSPRPVDPLAES